MQSATSLQMIVYIHNAIMIGLRCRQRKTLNSIPLALRARSSTFQGRCCLLTEAELGIWYTKFSHLEHDWMTGQVPHQMSFLQHKALGSGVPRCTGAMQRGPWRQPRKARRQTSPQSHRHMYSKGF